MSGPLIPCRDQQPAKQHENFKESRHHSFVSKVKRDMVALVQTKEPMQYRCLLILKGGYKQLCVILNMEAGSNFGTLLVKLRSKGINCGSER